jgi:undecaprenyl diphosphate synthase
MKDSTDLGPTHLPAHIGIIMDGNGRWARQRGLIRTQGHSEGLKAAKRVVQAASDLGIRYLTLYTFSTENWKRAVEEVGFLMGLIKEFLIAELDFYRENRIRIRFAGDSAGLPADVVVEIDRVVRETARYEGLSVCLAINYGGRDEIVRSVRRLAAAAGSEPIVFDAAGIAANLDNPDVPDPDLIVRTAGERRVSNFLLWQSAYSEYFFSDKLWPDWDGSDLRTAIDDYQRRDRRFGGVKS